MLILTGINYFKEIIMFLGILIGMFLFGLLGLLTNPEQTTAAGIARFTSWAFILIGLCGSIGWIIEVLN
jgi:hypothetical protein